MSPPQRQKADHGKETGSRTRLPGPVNQGPEALLQDPDLLALQHALDAPAMASAAGILALQERAGNTAVQRLLAQRLENEREEKQERPKHNALVNTGHDSSFKRGVYAKSYVNDQITGYQRAGGNKAVVQRCDVCDALACHSYALGADTGINAAYDTLGTRLRLEEVENKNRELDSISAKELYKIRTRAMSLISGLDRPRSVETDHDVAIGAGFREGQLFPEHMWLEDRTDNITYDTMPGGPLRTKKGVGEGGSGFKPPSESDEFGADEIARLSRKGYTNQQNTLNPHARSTG